MQKERILITGATGFLGQALVRILIENKRGASSAPQLFTLGRGDLKFPEVNHTSLNLENRSETLAYLKKTQPTQVYHLSGLSRVSKSISLADYFTSNTLHTQNLVDGLSVLPGEVKTLLASSVHVYGNQSGAVSEESGVHPQSSYAFSKFLSEECLKSFSRISDRFKVITIRLSTCFGPGQTCGFVASDLAQKVKEAKLKNLKKIITGPLLPFRQFMDFRDVATAFQMAMETKQTTPFEVYNLASPQKTTIQTLLNELLSLAQINVQIESQDNGENSFRGLDIPAAKFHSQWPHFSFRPFSETLSEIWDYNLKTPS
ncbi:MAG: SDR family oxidoreductase [Proteobacteria bacterium]|nr:SDR family oxidoreductase [Pseudomonadota bacterium]